ncbi:MAG: tRNA uridine-5-carboxymethylaminomethyl(34) synthesis enzyme MnmG [Planctomycetota bacterium]|nr:tRNA uridine-5-carboxymethylaminomethyl(34) synthesis enzyme MnmG [Planctomycetota bacterium]
MAISWNVVVVGGGHAGCEAAAASARLGMRTLLLTLDPNAVGRLSCNPAIGGIGKGQLAREVDALGGLMGRVTDVAGIQFRMLNTRKGKAVQSPRAQCDRPRYEKEMHACLTAQDHLEIKQCEAVQLRWKDGVLCGVVLASGETISTQSAILTTGTFTEGVLHLGMEQTQGGRRGEEGAAFLGEALRDLGLPTGRMKTGTPPRLLADSVDYSQLEEQPGDENPVPFSFLTDTLNQEQVVCWSSATTEETHRIVKENLSQAPMYAGRIEGKGPRYCPSLEDKVVRFADRDSHNIFLEPESVGGNLLYANGISTSLPADVQERFVKTCLGLKNAVIAQPGYAVEYTFVSPRVLLPTLEVKGFPGLYLAGQICGTSGYEEAAAQGIMAGYNAALKQLKKDDFVLGRHEGYIGVLIDDLIVSDPQEPYRMFTSRAEHRLLLRHDNADVRLTPRARALGGISEARWARFTAKKNRMAEATQILKQTLDSDSRQDEGKRRTWADRLRRPDGGGWKAAVEAISSLRACGLSLAEGASVEADFQYAGYARRQENWISRGAEREKSTLPDCFSFETVTGLRAEAVQVLSEVRPPTLGSASRLAGVTPADLALLEIALARRS